MTRHKIYTIIILLNACTLNFICAQETEEANALASRSFDSVRVHNLHSNRLAISNLDLGGDLTIISREEIKLLPVQSAAEILSYVLGADLRQRGPMGVQSDIQIQGSTFDQVLVLIDGVRMSDPQTGHHQMNLSIAPEAIERIEIVKGAAARRYGLNAMAGVVNIVTRTPSKRSAVAQIYRGYSAAAIGNSEKRYANQGYRFFNGFASDLVKGWFNIDADFGSGYRPNTDFQSIRSQFKIEQTLSLTKPWLQAGGLRIQYAGGAVRNSFAANGFYAPPADSNAYEHVNTQWAAVSAELSTRKAGVLSIRISARGNNDQYIFIRQNPAYYRNFHQTSVLNPELNYGYKSRSWELALGAEYRKEAILSTNLGDHSREFGAAFIDLLLKPVSWLKLSGAAYFLQNKLFGSKLYPGADANARLGKHLHAFASIGTGQRLPTYTDLYYRGPANLGNPDLLPERALYCDLGLRSAGKGLVYQFSVFQRNNAQLIDRIKDSASGPWRPVNLQSFAVRGFEARLSYLLRFEQVPGLKTKAALRLSSGVSVLNADAVSTAFQSQFALAYLPWQWISQIQFLHKTFSAGLHIRNVERFGLEAGKRNTYTLLDMRFDYTPDLNGQGKRPLKIWCTIQNLGNTAYREFAMLPLLPRWVTAGMHVRF